MRRLFVAILLASGLIPLVLATTGGPDTGGVVFVASDESDGPPHVALDIDAEGQVLNLGSDGSTTVTLPFSVDWYGSAKSSVTIGDDGALVFSGSPDSASAACPPTSWSGVAAYWDELSATTVQTATLGRYPSRLFVVEWAGITPGNTPGDGRVQVWFQEDRDEVVVVLDDVDFGDAAYDGGVGAVVGVGGGSAGLSWSCAGGLSSGSSAWFGEPEARPDAATVSLANVPLYWYGSANYDYLGQTLAGGDINGDGLSDTLLGAPQADSVLLIYGSPSPVAGDSGTADAVFGGQSADALGSAVAVADLDGDGAPELALGESGADQALTNAGAVYLFANDAFSGTFSVISDADATLLGPATSSSANAGTALAAGDDVDGDGYGDLAVGASGDDGAGTNAGAVYLWLGGSVSGSQNLSSGVVFRGEVSGDRLGVSASMADVDGDGLAELALGSPQSDATAVDAGKVYLISGGAWTGTWGVASAANASFTGLASLDYLGGAVVFGDFDGDGFGDLAAGARRDDSGATDAGAVYLFLDAASWSGTSAASLADYRIAGSASSQLVGSALAAGDIDGDGRADLVIGGPGARSSAGAAWVFRDVPTSANASVTDADHELQGGYGGGGAGGAVLAQPDLNGDGLGDVVVGAYFASVASYTLNGIAMVWSYAPSWLDADGDGLVSADARGPDCDDGDASVYPGGEEDTGLASGSVADDDDCDGYVDGVYLLRVDEALWTWDLDDVLGGPTPETFDFNAAGEGASLSSYYSGRGLELQADGSVDAYADVFGSPALGQRAARVSQGSANRLLLVFDDDVDAVALRLLDVENEVRLRAFGSDGSELLVNSGRVQILAAGDDIPGGRFAGVVFSEPVRQVLIEATSLDGWGIDELQVSWSEDSDRDGDGYTGLSGDCDDADAAVNPGATEDLANGIDDDCDGTIDGGGATAFTDLTSWEAASGIDVQVIDFEDLSAGDNVLTQYDPSGLNVDGTLDVSSNIGGAASNDLLAGLANNGTVILTFTEVQPAVALQILDGQGVFTLYGYANGNLLYGSTITAADNNVAGGRFTGFVYDYGVDELVIVAPTGDDWGVDDLRFSVLGLDDADGDGLTELEGDCDDSDASTAPGAAETWYDGVDADCDGGSDYDADGDGYEIGLDCDDGDTSVSPQATETWYDGVDEDCDGASDFDADGDGFDDEAFGGTDCDDSDASVSPNTPEVFFDGVDDNCLPYDDNDSDGDGFSAPGYPAGILGSDDCDDGDSGTSPEASEVWYDGIDQDCGGDTDYDADADGHDAEAHGGDDCDDFDASVLPGAPDTWYDGRDADCANDSDYDADLDGYDLNLYGGDDCDDTNPNIHPGVAESSNNDGIDEDCDGVDEWDSDLDGHRDANRGGDDCDDTDPAISPSAAELCYDGIDQNCSGSSDDLDCDGDGYDSDLYGGDDCDDADASIHPGAQDWSYDGVDQNCDGLDDYDLDDDGYQVWYYGGDDCDDTDAAIHPGATEQWYDGVDSDCDGRSDYDADQDGYDSELYQGPDCDDSDPSVAPGALELPYDGIDQDCDGQDASDLDGDGYAPLSEGGADCDDSDSTIYPGAADTAYDGVDSDCANDSDYDADGDGQDALVYGGADCDDGDPSVYDGANERWYDGRDQDCRGGDDYDQDGDGHQVRAWGGDDCNDTDPLIHPGIPLDDCGNGDEDCDGLRDEDCVTSDDSGGGDSGDDSAGSDSAGSDSGDDSGPDDSGGLPDDSQVQGDDSDGPGDSYDPDDTGLGGKTDRVGSCGCSSADPSAAWAALLAALALTRFRSRKTITCTPRSSMRPKGNERRGSIALLCDR